MLFRVSVVNIETGPSAQSALNAVLMSQVCEHMYVQRGHVGLYTRREMATSLVNEWHPAPAGRRHILVIAQRQEQQQQLAA